MVRSGVERKKYVNKRTPKGISIRFRKTKKDLSRKCAITGKTLFGVKMLGSRTKKRVSRLFGGFLSSKASKKVIKESVREVNK